MAEKLIDKQIHANELKLRILMTDGCNQDCLFCLNDFQPKPGKRGAQFLNSSIAKMAIEAYVKFFSGRYPLQVYFSGGEPTLHPQLMEIMGLAKALDCRVTLNTNGNFASDLESGLVANADEIHFGTYRKDERHAERIKRMGGVIQCIYPHVDDSFVEFYSKYGIPMKVFRDFYDITNGYQDFVGHLVKKFPEAKLSFRHTGLQENRGPGCVGCAKTCVTLKAAWVFPDGGSSPCPQGYRAGVYFNRTPSEWERYFGFVERFHKKI